MLLKATHNSCTAEKSKNILYWLMHPIAQCQRKTIKEQLEDGCTYFDLRVREINYEGDYRICHGLWKSSRTLLSILNELNDFIRIHPYNIYVDIIYEGMFINDEHEEIFMEDIENYNKAFPNIKFVNIGVKLPKWTVLSTYNYIKAESDFTGINFANKTAWFPFPYFWWKKRPAPIFNEECYKIVDFL